MRTRKLNAGVSLLEAVIAVKPAASRAEVLAAVADGYTSAALQPSEADKAVLRMLAQAASPMDRFWQ